MPLLKLSKRQIQSLFKKGHYLKNDLFALRYYKNQKSFFATRVCISFSSHMKLNKPQRNKLKRQIKAALIQENVEQFNFQLVIILLKLPCINNEANNNQKNCYQTLQEKIKNLLEKLAKSNEI